MYWKPALFIASLVVILYALWLCFNIILQINHFLQIALNIISALDAI